jgi:hypothetical protein
VVALPVTSRLSLTWKSSTLKWWALVYVSNTVPWGTCEQVVASALLTATARCDGEGEHRAGGVHRLQERATDTHWAASWCQVSAHMERMCVLHECAPLHWARRQERGSAAGGRSVRRRTRTRRSQTCCRKRVLRGAVQPAGVAGVRPTCRHLLRTNHFMPHTIVTCRGRSLPSSRLVVACCLWRLSELAEVVLFEEMVVSYHCQGRH